MKNECIASLTTSLAATAAWRMNNAERCPEDRRYERAARKLTRLADDAANLTDEEYAAIEPFVRSPRWNEAVKEIARKVGFAHRKMSLPFYLRGVVRAVQGIGDGGAARADPNTVGGGAFSMGWLVYQAAHNDVSRPVALACD